MKLVYGLFGGAVALVAFACAGGDENTSSSSSGDTTTVASGGSGGSGAATSTSGTGGTPSACGTDCTLINTPDCQVAQCNVQTGQCEIVNDEEGVACDDGVFCTISDSCSAGSCVGGPVNDCGMAPPQCTEVTCDETSQTCSTAPAANGAACQDPNDLCLKGSTCNNGLCIGGMQEDCFFTSVPVCHIAVCDVTDGVCKPQVGPDNVACNDPNDLCTVDKICTTGVCVGGNAKDCSQLTQGCVLGVCDVNNGQCVTQNLMNNDPCDDLNACTSGETCQNGGCSNGTPVTQCVSNDNCCPSGCTVNNDADCAIPVLYGNSTEYSTASSHTVNYLLGSAIVVTGAMTLTHLSIISKQTGPNVKIGLYSDSGGNPGTLIASIPSTAVALGVNEFPVSPMSLAAGTYWLMAVYSSTGSVGRDNNNNNVIKYISFTFANTLPTTFPAPTTYSGQNFNYYIKGLP